MAGHKLLTAEECGKTHIDDGYSCPICDGGLAYCTVCKTGEAEIPTDCPGRPVTEEESAAIMAGELDYVGGQWVNESNMKRRIKNNEHIGTV